MGHSAAFPLYPQACPARTLAALCLERGELVTEDGELHPAADYAALCAYLEAGPALVLSPPLVRMPWLAAAVADPGARVLVTAENGIAAIRIQNRRDGRKVGWVVPVSAWLPQKHVEPEDIRRLRACFELCDVGVAATPSSLGIALMRRHWQGKPLHRPNVWLHELLRKTAIGGRSDTLQQGKRLPLAIGEDMSAAYPWAAQRIPGGTACGFTGTPPVWAQTYYQDVVLLLPDDGHTGLSLGPVPQRTAHGTEYPTYGPVSGWLWREEIEAAMAAGALVVERGQGYAWRQLAPHLQRWAEEIYRLRQEGAADGVADLIKAVSVSAIGRFGMDRLSRTLEPYDGKGELYTDPETLWCGHDWKVVVRREPERADAAYLIQAYSYIQMVARCALYERALPHALDGALIATNYDEVLFTPSTRQPFSLERDTPSLGSWKRTYYRNLIVRHPRWKEGEYWHDGVWQEVGKTPGMGPEKRKQRYDEVA
jgi:hypothetical protein